MPHRAHFNYEEAMHGVLETRTALERARADVDRLERLLSERPRTFAAVAESAFRLRDRLIEDLGTLEASLARASRAPAAEEAEEDDDDVSLADNVTLGSQ